MGFRAFVLLAEMRTGSNHLEESLNALPDVASHGEAFNPVFPGAHNREELLGIDVAARDADPMPLLRAILDGEGITGFRLFHDHDPRVVAPVLDDPSVAKVILSRDPVESFVSLQIARETGQWRLTNPKMAKDAKIRFDADAFDAHAGATRAFRARVLRRLRETGQAPFLLDYAEIGDLDVVNGIAAFLGSAHRLDALPGRLKRQNPGAVEDKVLNPEEMRLHLAARAAAGADVALPAAPDPARGAGVPRMLGGARMLVMPLPGGPGAGLAEWLEAADGAAPARGMTRKDLRAWLEARPGFASVAVTRHPLLRAWDAFARRIAPGGPEGLGALRHVLRRHYGADLPSRRDLGDASVTGPAFKAFLRFAHDNLGGRSAVAVDASWASQTVLLAGMGAVVPPHHVLREDEGLSRRMAALAAALGMSAAPLPDTRPPVPEGVLDAEAVRLAQRAWRHDYLLLGYAPDP